MQQRSDSSFEAVLQERVQEFSLDPLGGYCVGRENQHEPVAPPKRRTDFVVPLLGPWMLVSLYQTGIAW